jgi:anti-sigma factor RsiW
MKCSQAAPLFSPYLDGAVSGKQMRAIQQHLDDCATCNREYVDLSRTQQLLSKVGRRKAPPEMSLKLRLAISREAARTPRNYFDVLCLRLQHTLQAFMVPAAVGLVTAVLLFGLFMGFSALPLQGDNHDVPLMLRFSEGFHEKQIALMTLFPPFFSRL